MTALGLRFFLLLGILLGILNPEAIALVPKKQLVNSGFAVTLAELPPPSHNCDLLTKTTYSYDANGNRLTRKIGPNTDLYSYDFENRLIALTKTTAGGEGNYEYTYDYRTRRVYRAEAPTNGPNVETQIVFSSGTSIQEITLGNTPELAVEYMRGSDYGRGIGGILYTIRDSTPSFTHYNHRGDIVSKTDDNGIITYEAQYEAFGTRLAESGATEDRQKANTKDEDPTGLLNEGFRYRDLETGTFLTRDPLGFVDGPNLYAYVMQNPWTFFDPEGLRSAQEAKWADIAADQNAGAAKRIGATLMGVLESINFLRSDSSIRDAGHMWNEGVAEANKTLDSDAPPVIREFTKLMIGTANAANIVTPSAGVGELVDSVKDEGLEQTAKNIALGVYHQAKDNPSMFAGELGIGLLWGKAGLGGRNAAKTPSASFLGNTRLEVQALQRQGLSRSEAFQQIRSFNAGNADGYLFHFTTQKGARGIVGEGVLNPSSSGVWGPGVYSGTTPTPGPFLKNIPFVGWGLGGKGANVRIPFQTTQPSITPWLPPRTRVFRDPVTLGGGN